CMTLFFSRFLFFFISRRPPSSLLFPYTTLFRSAAVDLGVALLAAVAAGLADGHALDPEGLQGLLDLVQLERLDDGRDELHPLRRSEEHTSELQSRENLVCRLLLEKKKMSR